MVSLAIRPYCSQADYWDVYFGCTERVKNAWMRLASKAQHHIELLLIEMLMILNLKFINEITSIFISFCIKYWILSRQKSISLEDIFTKNTFRAEAVAGFRSMKDGRYYSEIASDGNLQKVRFADGQVEKIILNVKKY